MWVIRPRAFVPCCVNIMTTRWTVCRCVCAYVPVFVCVCVCEFVLTPIHSLSFVVVPRKQLLLPYSRTRTLKYSLLLLCVMYCCCTALEQQSYHRGYIVQSAAVLVTKHGSHYEVRSKSFITAVSSSCHLYVYIYVPLCLQASSIVWYLVRSTLYILPYH